MPVVVILDKGHPFSFDCVGHHGERSILRPRGRQCLMNLRYGVPIYLSGFPAETSPLISHRLHLHDLRTPTRGLPLIEIHHGNQVSELMPRGKHRSLPNRPFLALPITHQDKSAIILLMDFCRQSHSQSNSQTMTKGSCRPLNPRGASWRGLLGQVPLLFIVIFQILFRKKARHCQGRIQGADRMPLAKNQPISF